MDCASKIGYRLFENSCVDRKDKNKTNFHLELIIQLMDCYRQIEWSFYNNYDEIKKLDKAIQILQSAKKAWLKNYKAEKYKYKREED